MNMDGFAVYQSVNAYLSMFLTNPTAYSLERITDLLQKYLSGKTPTVAVQGTGTGTAKAIDRKGEPYSPPNEHTWSAA